MITYDEALKKAKEMKPDIDNCTEYEDGYVFGSSADEGYIGGYGHTPVVILKKDGRYVPMPEFIITGSGKEIRSFNI